MKTSDLTGALLDYWVAKAEGRLTFRSTCPEDAGVYTYGRGGEIEYTEPLKGWSPSTDWEIGGLIIDREPFGIFERRDGEWFAGIYKPRQGFKDECVAYLSGPTILIAAMRAYVASKFGEEVPDGTDIQNG